MYSMTGYGKGVEDIDGSTLTIEIKAVNHRFLDLNIKLPRNLLFVEDTIKKVLSQNLTRGHLDVFVTFDEKSTQFGKFEADVELAKNYLEMANEMSKELNLQNDLTLSNLLKVNDIVSRTAVELDENLVQEKAMSAATQAVEGLKNMRLIEGERLKQDFLEKLQVIEDHWSEIKNIAPSVVTDFNDKLRERLLDLIGQDLIDNERVATEVALYADHCAIDEEITRLKAHVDNMRNLLNEENPIGRKLDFLVQELNRETNTIGSKANDIRITNHVLAIKNEIEKIREQAQNVE